MIRAHLARMLLAASGHAGAAGPRLASLCARAADALAWAAERVSPLAECPGCGAAVPALDLVGVERCGDCEEAVERFGRFVARVQARAAIVEAHSAVNVTPYAMGRRTRPEEPS